MGEIGFCKSKTRFPPPLFPPRMGDMGVDYKYMKIAIISDIHDNIPNLEKVLKYLKDNNIKKIICCGDFGTERTFDKLAEFKGEIFTVLGNMDEGYVEYNEIKDKYSHCRVWEVSGEIIIDNIRIGFTHKPEDAYLKISEQKNYFDIYFYGHTHKPWEQDFQGTRLVNPGNVANQFYPPTFAVFTTENKSLKLITINDLS